MKPFSEYKIDQLDALPKRSVALSARKIHQQNSTSILTASERFSFKFVLYLLSVAALFIGDGAEILISPKFSIVHFDCGFRIDLNSSLYSERKFTIFVSLKIHDLN